PHEEWPPHGFVRRRGFATSVRSSRARAAPRGGGAHGSLRWADRRRRRLAHRPRGRDRRADRAERRRQDHALQRHPRTERAVRGLPFGALRLVELGRALVSRGRLLMLDEPASGLNDAETDRLAAVIRRLRALDVAVLLIEHDVRMVTGVSDYVYVLDQGRMIA